MTGFDDAHNDQDEDRAHDYAGCSSRPLLQVHKLENDGHLLNKLKALRKRSEC